MRKAQSIVDFIRQPKVTVTRFWNKRLSKFFNNYLIPELPTNAQHMMIDEQKVVSLIQGNTLLDCGCDIGRWGLLLKKKRKHVVGFDISRKYITKRREQDISDSYWQI